MGHWRDALQDVAVMVEHEGHQLEAVLHGADNPGPGVLLCHPHPAFGGDMDVELMVALARDLAGRGLRSLRFNFRGVGGSGGEATGGGTEFADVLAAARWLTQRTQGAIHVVGYSFGALMSLAAATIARDPTLAPPNAVDPLPDALCSPRATMARSICAIGLPTRIGGWTDARAEAIVRLAADDCPVRLISGDKDQFCELPWLAEHLSGPGITLDVLPGQGHFFEGEAVDSLVQTVAQGLPSPPAAASDHFPG